MNESSKIEESHSYTWPLVASVLASSMAFIDGSALNVAMSALQKNLHASTLDLLWILNGYNIPVSALILLGGALGDKYGIKKIFSLGIIIFLTGSALCGLAPNALFLILARVFQGVGGALMIPSSLSYLSVSTPSENRGRAIGTWSAFSTLTTIIGPVLGGVLSGAGLWRMVFYLNIPLGIMSLWILLSKSKTLPVPATHGKIDYGGAFLITVSLALVCASLLIPNKTSTGFSFSTSQWIMLILSGALFLFFLKVEKSKRFPMIPLNVFKSRVFSGMNLMTLLLYSTLSGALFFVPLNLIQVQHYSDGLAGLASLPLAMMIIGLSPFAGALIKKWGSRLLLTVGPLTVGAAYIVLANIGITSGPNSYVTTYLPVYLLLGLGMGITIAPLTTAVMNSLKVEQSGLASGVNNATARVGGVLAIGVFGVIFLNLFKTIMVSKLSLLGIPTIEFNQMQKELANLAAAHIPSTLSSNIQNSILENIREAFVSSFALICEVAAFLCVLSAAVSFFSLKKDVSPPVSQ